jgi:hypothetical protein
VNSSHQKSLVSGIQVPESPWRASQGPRSAMVPTGSRGGIAAVRTVDRSHISQMYGYGDSDILRSLSVITDTRAWLVLSPGKWAGNASMNCGFARMARNRAAR